jgi:hypothetical protein
LPGQVWNDEFRAAVTIAAPQPPWWIDNINPEFVSGDVEIHQGCPIALESVSYEPPGAIVAGTDSLSAVFQPASEPSGFSQQSLDLNVPANFDIDVELEALLAFPDGSNCMVFQDSTSLLQSNWNSIPLLSTPRSDCDISSPISTVSTPLGNGTLCHKSHQNRKSQISVLPSFKCPHCSAFFTSEQRVGYVVLLSYGWILLMITGLTFTHPIGMPANVMVVGSVSRSQKI